MLALILVIVALIHPDQMLGHPEIKLVSKAELLG
jgi:hypothetical protein